MATTDNLSRRGMILEEEAKCCQLCKEEEENIRHLFFECKVSYLIWSNILKWLGVSMALHIVPSRHFLLFENCLRRGNKAKVAASIWIGIVWSIWTLRNEVIFNKAVINVEKEVCKIKFYVRNWLEAKVLSCSELSISNWLENPTECMKLL
ncbi:hypothetical protein ACS0TY_029915 [Phlomoides rotata]